MPKTFCHDGGFSLAELLVVLAILGVVLAGAYQLLDFGLRSSARTTTEAQTLQEARLALTLLIGQLREARPPDDAGTPAVELTGGSEEANAASIYTDTDGDQAPEKVSWRITVDGRLQYAVAEPVNDMFPWSYGPPGEWITVATSVANDGVVPLFTRVTRDPTAVDYLQITLLVRPGAAAPPLHLETGVAVRNRRPAGEQ